MLLTLLRNLVENGQKASENTPVTVTGVRDGERDRFSVIDQGSGMTAEQVQRATGSSPRRSLPLQRWVRHRAVPVSAHLPAAWDGVGV